MGEKQVPLKNLHQVEVILPAIISHLFWLPVDDPFGMFVVVDSPKGYPYYGGTVAAPAFREVVGDSLRYLGFGAL